MPSEPGFNCPMPRAGSAVVRMDPLHFVAGCCTRLQDVVLACCTIVLWFIRALFMYCYVVFVAVCSVVWLFWLSCHYLPSDWLERLL